MMILQFIKIIIILYFSLVSLLYFFQRSLIYFPDKSQLKKFENSHFINVKTSDGLDLQGLYFPPRLKNGMTIIYFHGNGGNSSHRYFKIRSYLRLGYGVLLAEYRGYGGNDGTPSEEGFYADGRAYMDWAMRNMSPNKLVIYGESIGTGTATQMATEYSVQALILETPFSSLTDIAAEKYFYVPVKYLLNDQFDNFKKINKIHVPLLMLHGQKDTTIDIKYAKRLYDAAIEPKKFIEFPNGDHLNLYDFGAAEYVIEFLKGINK